MNQSLRTTVRCTRSDVTRIVTFSNHSARCLGIVRPANQRSIVASSTPSAAANSHCLKPDSASSFRSRWCGSVGRGKCGALGGMMDHQFPSIQYCYPEVVSRQSIERAELATHPALHLANLLVSWSVGGMLGDRQTDPCRVHQCSVKVMLESYPHMRAASRGQAV